MKTVLYCAVICFTLTCMTGYSGSVHGEALSGFFTKTQRSRDLPRDLDERSESSEESDSSEDSSEDQTGIKVPTCPDGWSQNGTSCYILVTDFGTWEAARIGCQAINSTLVEITTRAELDFLNNKFPSLTVWIGLKDKTGDNSLVWDASGSPVFFENWNSNQPKDNVDCVAMLGPPTFAWITAHCDGSISIPYICERQADC